MAWNPLASVGRMLIFWVAGSWRKLHWRPSDTSHVRCTESDLDVHDVSLASGSADVLGYEVSPASAYCSGTGTTDIT